MKRKWVILAALTVTHFGASSFGVLMLFALGGAALARVDGEIPSWVAIYLTLLWPVLKLPFGWLALEGWYWPKSYQGVIVFVTTILFLNSLAAVCLGWLVYDCVLRIRRSHARNKSAA